MSSRAPRAVATGLDRATRSAGLMLVGLALLSSVIGIADRLDRGYEARAGTLAVAAVAALGILLFWWSVRGGRAAPWAAIALVTVSTGAWFVAGTPTGLPLVAVAICVLLLEVGAAVAWCTGAGLLVVVTAMYLASDEVPLGGIVANLVTIGLFLTLALLVGQLVAGLDSARRSAESEARARREGALAELDRALTAERMVHARTLHDELGHRLTLIGMGLDLAGRTRSTDPDAAWEEVDRSRTEASTALSELRALVRALSPVTSGPGDDTDLDSALDRLAASFRGTGLEVRITREGAPGGGAEGGGAAPDPLAIRIIQEGLTNVARHSDATTVEVVLGHGRGHGRDRTVRVADDGTAGRATVDPGFGLHHLRSRVEAAGGTLTAERGEGGFVLSARYPAPIGVA